jgi:hypothetical protein
MTEQLSTYKPSPDQSPVITENNPHVKALADTFEILFAGKSEAKQLINARIPKKLTIEHYDSKVYNARELLLSEGLASTPLVQIQYFNTVLEGARLVKCAREAIRAERMTKGNTIRLPFQSTNANRAPEVPEMAPYRNSGTTYSYRDFTIKKYGEIAPITDEMIADSLYNTMALEVGVLGEHLENALNYEAIGVITQNCGKSADAATTAGSQGIKALANAKLAVQGLASTEITTATGGFTADTAIVTTEFDCNLNKEFLLTNYWGGQSVVNGSQPPALGLRYFVTSSPINSSSYGSIWKYATDNDIGGIVFNRMAAGAYVMREDITIEDLKEPLQDLTTAKGKIRFGVNYGIANATCRMIF